MKLFSALRGRLKDAAQAIVRFPVTFLLLLLTAVLLSVSLETRNSYNIQLISLAFGSFCFLAAQALCERFAKKLKPKIFIYAAAAAISVVYYLLVRSVGSVDIIVGVNTGAAIFALFVLFLWIPSVREASDFNIVFLSVFKGVFTSVFYSAVIWGGLSLIFLAVDTLLVKLPDTVYEHMSFYIFIVLAPVLFLSFLPVFNKGANDDKLRKASIYPKFFEIVLSYILVPLVSVYTLVLLIYIIKTAAQGSWSDNLLEPLMLSWCITVLILYILLSRLQNHFAHVFLKVFPPLLCVIALFQIVSSLISVFNYGIYHGKYFVLLFGVYSVLCGILLFIFPVKKNGIAAFLAVCFAFFSLLPFIGSFPVSIASQKALLTGTLEKNNMLSGYTIIPKGDIADRDKSVITRSFTYLSRIGKTDTLEYLPDVISEGPFAGDYEGDSFEKTFGFSRNNVVVPEEHLERFYARDALKPIILTGYDYMTNIAFHMPESMTYTDNGTVVSNGIACDIVLSVQGFSGTLKIITDKTELISVPLESIFEKFMETETNEKGQSASELIFDYENDSAKIRLIVNEANIFISAFDNNRYANCSMLFSVK